MGFFISSFQLLSKLLKSKHPDDLQAANRLIKNMVKQDEEKQEKRSQRSVCCNLFVNTLATVYTG